MFCYSSGGQKSKVSSTGPKPGCQLCPTRGFRGERIHFLAFFQLLKVHSLTCGSFLHLQRHQHSIFQSLLPRSHYLLLCGKISPLLSHIMTLVTTISTCVIQDHHPISRSLIWIPPPESLCHIHFICYLDSQDQQLGLDVFQGRHSACYKIFGKKQ